MIRITKLEPLIKGWVNGIMTEGHRVILHAEAVSDFGKRYVAEKVVFVVPRTRKLKAEAFEERPDTRQIGVMSRSIRCDLR